MAVVCRDWKYSSEQFQNKTYEYLGDRVWDNIKRDNVCVKKKVFAGLKYIKQEDFSSSQLERISDKITNKILDLCSHEVNINFIYVNYLIKGETGLGKIHRLCKVLGETYDFTTSSYKENVYIIDEDLRVYSSWNDYLTTNALPNCNMYYPELGEYSNARFKYSDNLSYNEVLDCVDTVKTVLDIASIGVILASNFMNVPEELERAARYTKRGCDAYDIARNAYKLYDIHDHDGDISCSNREAAGAWMSIAQSCTSLAAMEGSQSNRGVQLATIAAGGSLITYSFAKLVYKYATGDLDYETCEQFINHIFFSFNIFISQYIAKRIIGEAALSNNVEDVLCTVKNRVHVYTKKMLELRNESDYNQARKLILKFQEQFLPELDIRSIEEMTFNVVELVHTLTSDKINWIEFFYKVAPIIKKIWNMKDKLSKPNGGELVQYGLPKSEPSGEWVERRSFEYMTEKNYFDIASKIANTEIDRNNAVLMESGNKSIYESKGNTSITLIKPKQKQNYEAILIYSKSLSMGTEMKILKVKKNISGSVKHEVTKIEKTNHCVSYRAIKSIENVGHITPNQEENHERMLTNQLKSLTVTTKIKTNHCAIEKVTNFSGSGKAKISNVSEMTKTNDSETATTSNAPTSNATKKKRKNKKKRKQNA